MSVKKVSMKKLNNYNIPACIKDPRLDRYARRSRSRNVFSPAATFTPEYIVIRAIRLLPADGSLAIFLYRRRDDFMSQSIALTQSRECGRPFSSALSAYVHGRIPGVTTRPWYIQFLSFSLSFPFSFYSSPASFSFLALGINSLLFTKAFRARMTYTRRSQ